MRKRTSKVVFILLIFGCLLLPMAVLTACEGAELPVEAPVIEIEDVEPSDWFYRYVVGGLRFGIIASENGESLRFEPERYVTQGEFITMLGLLHEYGNEVIGTPDDDPLRERYIDWAMECEIIHSNKYWGFMPDAYITREQKAVIVYRYIGAFNLRSNFRHVYHTVDMTFDDYCEMSYWARGPIEHLRLLLLAHGKYNWSFMPHDFTTHAEAIRILTRVGSAVYDLVHPMR